MNYLILILSTILQVLILSPCKAESQRGKETALDPTVEWTHFNRVELYCRNLAALCKMNHREERPQMVTVRESPGKGNNSQQEASGKGYRKKGMNEKTGSSGQWQGEDITDVSQQLRLYILEKGEPVIRRGWARERHIFGGEGWAQFWVQWMSKKPVWHPSPPTPGRHLTSIF